MGGSGDSGSMSRPPPSETTGSSGSTGGGSPVDPCDTLAFRTTLNSPEGDVVDDLEMTEELDVSLDDEGAVVARRRTGQVAGSITANVADLLRCLDRGRSFVAIVRSIEGGAVTVDVQPA